MRAVLCAFLLCGLPLAAQTPPSTPASPSKPSPVTTEHQTPHPPSVEDSDLGFAFSLPLDWQYVPPAPAPTVVVPYPTAVEAPKGDACVKVELTATRGTPTSSVVVTVLPFSCYGQAMTLGDLANLGAGATEGLKEAFHVANPIQSNYILGNHAVWIERAKGAPKAHPADSYTFETACTILTNGAVCWTAMTADAASLRAFEKAPVSLEGEHFAALVPADAFLPRP